MGAKAPKALAAKAAKPRPSPKAAAPGRGLFSGKATVRPALALQARDFTRSGLAALCARLAGGEPFSLACRDPALPGEPAVREAMAASPEVAAEIAAACDAGFDAIAERARQTARGGGDSTDNVARDKLIIDTDLKLLALRDPRRYGARPAADPLPEPARDTTWPDNETAARLAAILEAAKMRKGEG